MGSPQNIFVLTSTPSVGISDYVNHFLATASGIEWPVFVGIDADTWNDIDEITGWVTDFNKELRKNKYEQFILTAVIILAWPDIFPGDLGNYKRFNQLLLSGCKLRNKRLDFYKHDLPATVESFEADLKAAGWLRMPVTGTKPASLKPPTFPNTEEEENYDQRLSFYGNPPFQWGSSEKKRVFPKSP